MNGDRARWPRLGPEDLGTAFDSWSWGIPLVFRSLHAEPGGAPLPRCPTRATSQETALGYWSALLHMLVYSLGWADPAVGMVRWMENGGIEVDDPRMRILRVYESDGMLDLFTAWLCTNPHLGDLGSTLHAQSDIAHAEMTNRHRAISPKDAEAWRAQLEAKADQMGIHNPLSGGTDPLHLSGHWSDPLHEPAAEGLLVRSGRTQRRAVLIVDDHVGWYRQLTTLGAQLPDLGNRSWHVDVVVRTIGFMGTYRHSRRTGLWFNGPHRLHEIGST